VVEKTACLIIIQKSHPRGVDWRNIEDKKVVKRGCEAEDGTIVLHDRLERIFHCVSFDGETPKRKQLRTCGEGSLASCPKGIVKHEVSGRPLRAK